MAITKSFAGQTFSLPQNREPRSSDWGTQVSNFLVALADYAIPKTGGAYTLAAELNLGATYGLRAPYYKSSSSSIAASGVVRLANGNTLAWRNAANNADLALTVGADDALTFNGSGIQPLDADLTALAALSSTGILARTASNTYALRSIAAGSNKLSISNADGMSGNPTLDVVQGNLSLGSLGGSVALGSQVSGTLPIANGGTGQTSANSALNALLPSQSGKNGYVLGSDGTDTAWVSSLANPMDGVGQLIVGGTGGAAAKFAAGTAGAMMTAQGTGSLPTWNFVADANVDSSAAIARSKLASGSNNHVLINNGSGVMTSESALARTRGGTGVSSTATYPTSATDNADFVMKGTVDQTISGNKRFTNLGARTTGTGDLIMRLDRTSGTTSDWSFTLPSASVNLGLSTDALGYILTASGSDGAITLGGSTIDALHSASSNSSSGTFRVRNFLNSSGGDGAAALRVEKFRNVNTTSQIYAQFIYNTTGGSTSAGGIRGNGSTGWEAYSGSDRRIKQDIEDLEPALDKILQLRPRKFRLKSNPEMDPAVGFVAQEFAEVFPEAVAAPDDGEGDDVVPENTWTMSHDRLVIHLTRAVQELAARVAALEGTTA